ncbi:hypothetical protein IC006_2450 [Sulfuracidifex tepidarius]|uniref:Uncharacterized protein n=1 Tax=Sulfuracidifex tepidarius TaxID=1294262 RepID=A0A510E640_9CREN|nr:hypothetical protein IC006_2450 [Sulfuracidifex tepidarius]BBG27897.1 hypothetical protein IC007_2452 [Sulfuracidifex tepidarius]
MSHEFGLLNDMKEVRDTDVDFPEASDELEAIADHTRLARRGEDNT